MKYNIISGLIICSILTVGCNSTNDNTEYINQIQEQIEVNEAYINALEERINDLEAEDEQNINEEVPEVLEENVGAHITPDGYDNTPVETNTIPNCIGLHETEFSLLIKNRGNIICNVKRAQSSEVEQGYVISQSINPGTTYGETITMDVTISLGIIESVEPKTTTEEAEEPIIHVTPDGYDNTPVEINGNAGGINNSN